MCNFSHRRTCLRALCRLISLSFVSSDIFLCKCLHTETWSRASLCIKRLVFSCSRFWLTKIYLYVTFNIWHRVCHLIFYRCSWNTRLFNLRTRLCMHLLTYKAVSEYTALAGANGLWRRVHWKMTCLYLLLTYKGVSVCSVSHRKTCLCGTCHQHYYLSGAACFHANVST